MKKSRRPTHEEAFTVFCGLGPDRRLPMLLVSCGTRERVRCFVYGRPHRCQACEAIESNSPPQRMGALSSQECSQTGEGNRHYD